MIAVFPPGSALERKKSIGLRDLVGLPLVVMESGSNVRKLVDQAFESIGEFVRPAFEATCKELNS